MPTKTVLGTTIDVTEDGFMSNRSQWTREIAQALAEEAGIGPLNDRHWTVIEFCRKDMDATQQSPGLRRIAAQSGVAMKELYVLFPKGPGKLAALVSGLPKPQGCV
jgi:dissimilatory sulfite reductase related protein